MSLSENKNSLGQGEGEEEGGYGGEKRSRTEQESHLIQGKGLMRRIFKET